MGGVEDSAADCAFSRLGEWKTAIKNRSTSRKATLFHLWKMNPFIAPPHCVWRSLSRACSTLHAEDLVNLPVTDSPDPIVEIDGGIGVMHPDFDFVSHLDRRRRFLQVDDSMFCRQAANGKSRHILYQGDAAFAAQGFQAGIHHNALARGLAQHRGEDGQGKIKIRAALLIICVHEQVRACLDLSHAGKSPGE